MKEQQADPSPVDRAGKFVLGRPHDQRLMR